VDKNVCDRHNENLSGGSKIFQKGAPYLGFFKGGFPGFHFGSL